MISAGVQTTLGRRLVWTSLLRFAVLALFLVVIESYYLNEVELFGFSSSLAVGTVVIGFGLSALFALVLRSGKQLEIAAHAQLLTDQLTWTAIVYISGGITSGASTLYGLTCLTGAVLLGTNGAVFASVAGVSFYLLLCWGLVSGWLPPPNDQVASAYYTTPAETAYAAFSTVVALVIVTVLASYLTERLRAFGGQLKEATKRVEEAEHLAALGRLSAALAHEIRNPLGAIKGSVELLRTGRDMAPEDLHLCLLVERETARLNALVTDMMDLSKRKAPVLRQVNLAETARSVLKLANQSARGSELQFEYNGPPNLSVTADGAQMHQVLWNLVRNAIQVSPGGCRVTVAIEKTKGGAQLSVSDEGPGIPEKAHHDIFNAYYTTRAGGTGIGLAVVKRITDAHNFDLSVISSEGDGCVFNIRVPAAALIALVLLCTGCRGSRDWVAPTESPAPIQWDEPGWQKSQPRVVPAEKTAAPTQAKTTLEPSPAAPKSQPATASSTTLLQLKGRPQGQLFRNTYYDFPVEPSYLERGPTKRVYNSQCKPIRTVSAAFHDALCVQGSGRLSSGETLSFARRDCACAALCPRTNQKICFDRLDKKRFPWGRGASGRAITPMRSVAVDSAVIPLGTPIFLPDLVGLRSPTGSQHDGCFLAEDRGLKVRGRHIDIFTGSPAATRHYNHAWPSNRGVRVIVGAAKCRYLSPRRTRKSKKR